jgi:hypothetical protein
MSSRHLCVILPGLLWVGATFSPNAFPQAESTKQVKALRPPSPEPVSAEELEKFIARGVDYLCQSQNLDGSWGSPRWTGGVDVDPVPGAFHSFGVASTALCLEALLGAGDSPKVRKATERAQAYLLSNLSKLRRGDPGNLPNVWGYCYGIQVLAELHRRSPPDSDPRRLLEKLVTEQCEGLKRCETVHGGWFYYARGLERPFASSCSFVNSAVLIALHRAKGMGTGLNDRVLKRAIQSTAEQRNPDSSYLYSMMSPLTKGTAAKPINRPAGSLGRSQACNLALRLWGDSRITDEVLKDWLDRLVTRNGWLDMGRKRPIPHESFAQVAGYFFYFGHYYAALCIGELPQSDRAFYQDHLARLLMRLQEKDGSWWDYPMYSYHKAYGTAFALLSLESCRKSPTTERRR